MNLERQGSNECVTFMFYAQMFVYIFKYANCKLLSVCFAGILIFNFLIYYCELNQLTFVGDKRSVRKISTISIALKSTKFCHLFCYCFNYLTTLLRGIQTPPKPKNDTRSSVIIKD